MKHAKHLIIAVVFIAICHLLHGQNIGINTTGAVSNASALLDVGAVLVAGACVDVIMI